MTRAYRFLDPIVLLSAVCWCTPPPALAPDGHPGRAHLEGIGGDPRPDHRGGGWQSGIKTVGIYAGALGFGYNPELGSRSR